MINICLKRLCVIGVIYILIGSLLFSHTLLVRSDNGRSVTKPDIDGPSSIYITETATFYVSSTDSGGKNVRYGFDWKTYGDFIVDEWTTYYTSGHTIVIDHTFETGGYYDIAAIAENVDGVQSEISFHDFQVNGGVANYTIEKIWTEPDRFIPNQTIRLKAIVNNTGTRDSWQGGGPDRGLFIDEIPQGTWQAIPIFMEVGVPLTMATNVIHWPNDYYNHTIICLFKPKIAYKNKSAVENEPPNKPSRPNGTTSGKPEKEYTYTSSTLDPNEHQIYYLFDWGDGIFSGWLGPYESGETVSASHKWYEGTYEIKVKSKDIHDAESNWSDPLPISMPKSKTFFYNSPLLNWLFERFPLLQRLLIALEVYVL